MTSTTLIGREQDIVEVSKLLAKPEVRLVTLTGPGGIGKTRLAIAVGEQLDDRYPQGTVFVPLASIAQPELVLPRIAAAVGVTIEGVRPPLDVLVEQFAETPTLLVLDNLEQVVGVAPDLDQLLARCPGLEILATSRTVLRLRAEREYPVGPLTVPAFSGRAPIEQLASLPAVQLFVDRAQAVRYDFALTDDNALAVVEICRRLDGLPLAIELAAARARLLEPEALLARLGSRLDALGTGPVDLPERQRTLRATVEWSVGLLDDAEQHMLATLSIFVEGWTVEAAAARLRPHRRSDARSARLSRRAQPGERRCDRLPGRGSACSQPYGSWPPSGLPPARTWRTSSGGTRSTSVRSWRTPTGPLNDRPQWAERLRTEEGNLGVAIRWFFTHDIAPLPHIFLILCQNTRLFWQMRDRMPEGRAWIQELLLRADALDDRAQAELLLISAVTAVEVGDDDSAQAAVEGIERLEGRIDDPYLESAAQLAVSWILPIVDDFDGALQAASTALDGFREQNEPFMAWAALTVGLLEMTLGRDDAARDHLTEANELGGQFGNKWLESVCTNTARLARCQAGQLDEARAQLVESVDASEDTELSTQTVTFSLVAYAPPRSGGKRCTAGRDGLGRGRRAAPARGIAGLAVDAARRGGAGHPRGAGDRSRRLQGRLRGRIRLDQREAVALSARRPNTA